MPSRGAGLAGLLLTMAVAHAAPPRAEPPPEATQAAKDSAFIQRLLREPFGGSHDQAELAVTLLRMSGASRDEAERLERAEQRRLLARVTGEPYARPRTVGEAIVLEAGGEKIDGKPALARVTIDFAAPAAARAIGVPAGAKDVGHGVWTEDRGQISKVHVALTIRNALALPVREAGFQFGRQADGKYLVSLSCEIRPSIGPGQAATVPCMGMDRAERIGPALQALAAHAPAGPFTADWVRTTEASVLFGHVDREISGDGPGRRARQMLVAASCEDKGTCAVIAKAESDRRRADWHERRGGIVVTFGAVLALVLGIVAALRVRQPGPGGWAVSTLAVVATLYAGLALAATYIAVRPHAGYEALLAFVVIYFGAIPFLVVLAIVVASLRDNATRPRAFAAAFCAVATVTIAAAIFLVR